MTGRGGEWGVGVASLRACEAIQLMVQEEAGLPRRFAPRNDGEGTPSLRSEIASLSCRPCVGQDREKASRPTRLCYDGLRCVSTKMVVIASRPTRLCYDQRLRAEREPLVIASRPTRLCYDGFILR